MKDHETWGEHFRGNLNALLKVIIEVTRSTFLLVNFLGMQRV